jgi:hypothetical protein
MSTDTEHDNTTPMAARFVNQAFRIALLAFLTGGAILTFGQVAGVILGRGSLIVTLEDIVAIPTYVCASIAGLLAFLELYASGHSPKEEH